MPDPDLLILIPADRRAEIEAAIRDRPHLTEQLQRLGERLVARGVRPDRAMVKKLQSLQRQLVEERKKLEEEQQSGS